MRNLTESIAAEAEARLLLGESVDRWRHVEGVAAAAGRAAGGVPDDDVELLVAAAWLHDIGYAASLAITGLHQLDGARYLRDAGASERLCRLVANHSCAMFEAETRDLGGVLGEEFPVERSAVADVLTYADMTTGPQGASLSIDERLNEILDRYPAGHVVHESIKRASAELVASVQRVEEVLAEPYPR